MVESRMAMAADGLRMPPHLRRHPEVLGILHAEPRKMATGYPTSILRGPREMRGHLRMTGVLGGAAHCNIPKICLASTGLATSRPALRAQAAKLSINCPFDLTLVPSPR